MIVWSDALICFVFRDRALFHKNTFLQIRHIKEMFRLLFDKSSESGVFFSHYQCLAGRGNG
jgi:AGCS family alanine or glycine:cation symporter